MIGVKSLALTVNAKGESRRLTFEAGRLMCCGWAGRNRDAVEAHIEELAQLGVPRPTRVPTFMNFSPYLLTTDREMTVVSDKSSGEVECVLLCRGDDIWVTVGSDQTDRDVETKSIPASKQMCGKFIAASCWPYREVADHWDELVLRCWTSENGTRSLYQEGALGGLLSPRELLCALPDVTWPPRLGVVLFSGTIATRSGLVFGEAYDLELDDPVLNRKIAASYRVNVLSQYL
ncbi:MAG TPA: DUF2848 domain-containing protein [Vicinamibacterales bacterium]|nr:DUF2848 domain-containing protein [Vicinamibacterales bacterium]